MVNTSSINIQFKSA